jgi:hypothetical protein
VKAPTAADAAGAALVTGTGPGGTVEATADITLRTTPDVGLDLSFGTLPTGLSALNFTLTGLRVPTSCPAPAATVGASATSKQVSTVQTTTAPLPVAGCGALPYAPQLTATVDKNAGDPGATFTTTVTGAVTNSATKTFELDLPSSLSPNVSAAFGCLLGTPCTIGTAAASSPLLPSSALSTGTVQLGGSISAPTLAVTFPPPYPISLAGTIDISHQSLTFNGIPDLPLTSLALKVGGTSTTSLFTTTCAPSSLTVKLTPWDGAAQQTTSAPITFGTGCAAAQPVPPILHTTIPGKPTLSGASLRGLVSRAAKLAFTVSEGDNAGPIKRIALRLAEGLTFRSRKNLGEGLVVRVPHAKKVKFATSIGHAVLTITLSAAAAKVQVTLGSPAIGVSSKLSKNVKSQLRRKKVSVLRFAFRLTDSAKHATRLTLRVKPKS